MSNKKNSATTIKDGIKSIKIIDKIYSSAEKLKEIKFNDNSFQKNLVNKHNYRMIILGLNVFHGDAAACILKDDRILVAVEEEDQ